MRNPSVQELTIYEMLKSGKPVAFADMVKAVGVKEITVMTYICALRQIWGGEVETIRNGRKVESYQLNNAGDLAKHMVLKGSGLVTKTAKVAKAPKVVKVNPIKAAKVAVAKSKTVVARKPKADEFDVPTLDSDLDISEVSDRELDDLKMQLGL
jgi:hypothetical protein